MLIHFILVEPGLPENVGAAARALKTMGFHSLRLVNPCDHLQDRARWVAHGSTDILENARVFTSLEDAVADVDMIVGTSAKSRTVKDQSIRSQDVRGGRRQGLASGVLPGSGGSAPGGGLRIRNPTS